MTCHKETSLIAMIDTKKFGQMEEGIRHLTMMPALTAAVCASCNAAMFEEYKRFRQEQILTDLLRKLDLQTKPNVTVDYDNLPPIGHNNPRVKELIEKTMAASGRQTRTRLRRSVNGGGGGGRRRAATMVWPEPNFGGGVDEEVQDHFPELYELEPDVRPQTVYVLAESPDSLSTSTNDDGAFHRVVGRDPTGTHPTALFRFASKLAKKYVDHARLSFSLRRPEDFALERESIPILIEVYERYANGSLGVGRIAMKHIDLRSSGAKPIRASVELNELDVQNWLRLGNDMERADGSSMVGLFIRARYGDENLIAYPPTSGIADINNNSEQQEDAMFIELALYDYYSAVGRARRSTSGAGEQKAKCTVGDNNTKCCLYDLMIDFEKVGWEFVIAPKRYNAFICNGECSPSQMSATARGTIAQQAHLDYLQCCHPKEYNGITIVYVTESNQVWVKEVPGMVAKRCGCA